MTIRKNRIGKRYGKLIVTAFSHTNTKGNSYWYILCDCGNSKVVGGNNLQAGRTSSCGCMASLGRRTHRMSGTPTYKTWHSLKQRCLNKNNKGYVGYGGRGITVCDRWLNSFENFYTDMGEKPKGLTIERINNDGNYEPSNCKWATPQEQMNNTRHNVILTYNGISMNMQQWARKLGISRACIWDRLNRNMPIDIILSKEKFGCCEARNIIHQRAL